MRIIHNPQSIGISICLLLSSLSQVSKAEEKFLPDAIGDLSISIQDMDGRERFPFRTGDAKAAVLLFVTPDCPISNAYAPEMARLKSEFGSEGFKLMLVYVDPDVSDDGIAEHMKDFSLTGYVAIADRRHTLVKAVGATVTPEAVVALSDGVIAYRGRIDNMYPSLARISHKLSTALRYVGAGGDFPGFGTLQGVDPASPPNLHETPANTRPPFARHEFCEICGLGDRRRVITEKDLRKALGAIIDNREIPVARTQAVGCYIPNL